jgi:hypothetical protein
VSEVERLDRRGEVSGRNVLADHRQYMAAVIVPLAV